MPYAGKYIAQASLHYTLPDQFLDARMSCTEAAVKAHLSQFMDPHLQRDIVSSGALRSMGIDGANVALEIRLAYPAERYGELLRDMLEAHVLGLAGVANVAVDVSWGVHAHKVQGDLTPLPKIKNIIAIASGKGGVGKSTTAVNIALALRSEGAQVGLLDADIYGPSQVMMLGITGRAESTDGGYSLQPKIGYGVEMMSMGLMAGEDTPMVLRGPMVTKAMMEMLTQTNWGELDYLVIDLPPGTGDIQLTLAQRVPVSGAIIVTTPQNIALLDAQRALRMFEKVSVPVLGVVENMASHICSQCGHEDAIFGAGGGAKMSENYAVNLLGQLPLDRSIREQADGGKPTVVAEPESELANRYRMIARRAAAQLSLQARNKAISFPKIVINP
jgi:ATP-binding protein involved in chromosome partitioning